MLSLILQIRRSFIRKQVMGFLHDHIAKRKSMALTTEAIEALIITRCSPYGIKPTRALMLIVTSDIYLSLLNQNKYHINDTHWVSSGTMVIRRNNDQINR